MFKKLFKCINLILKWRCKSLSSLLLSSLPVEVLPCCKTEDGEFAYVSSCCPSVQNFLTAIEPLYDLYRWNLNLLVSGLYKLCQHWPNVYGVYYWHWHALLTFLERKKVKIYYCIIQIKISHEKEDVLYDIFTLNVLIIHVSSPYVINGGNISDNALSQTPLFYYRMTAILASYRQDNFRTFSLTVPLIITR